jgi:hypothetical protein
MGRKVSVTSPFRFADCTIATCTVAATSAWWQTQGIDPLPIATSLWEKTHAIAPAEAEVVGDRDRLGGINTQVNGSHFGDEAAAADRRQIDETKPILPPEAG